MASHLVHVNKFIDMLRLPTADCQTLIMFIFKFNLSENVTGQKRNFKAGQFETTQCTNRKIIKCSTVVYGDSSSRICGGFVRIVTSLEMTSQEVTGSEVTGTEMKGR